MIQVGLIDDHAMFRDCLKDYLSAQDSIQIPVSVDDPDELFNKLTTCKIDVILVDLFMPKITGDKLITILKEKFPDVKIIMLSMCVNVKAICNLIDKGIHNYISKADPLEVLVKAIYAVYENRVYRSKLFTEALYLNNIQKANYESNNLIEAFTEREKKIIQLLWQEKSNKEISNELFLGIRSIEKIRQDLKERAGVKTTIGLIKYALTNNIIFDPATENLISTRKY